MLFMDMNSCVRARHTSQHSVSQLLWLSAGLNKQPISPFCFLGMSEKCVHNPPWLIN